MIQCWQECLAKHSHITAEKLDAALRDVKNCFNRYTLPHYWGEEKRAASDGTQYELAEENLLAEKHIRYGGLWILTIKFAFQSDNFSMNFSASACRDRSQERPHTEFFA